MNKNLDIRAAARGRGVYLYEVAEVMGITLTRRRYSPS